MHHRVRIPVRAVHLVAVQLSDDVVVGLFLVPLVRRLRQRRVDGRLVPDNPGEGVLVLVLEPERVADLMERRIGIPLQVPAEVHRPLRRAHLERVRSDDRPRAVSRHEADAHLCLGTGVHLLELQPDPQLLPLRERLAHHPLLPLPPPPPPPPPRAPPRPRPAARPPAPPPRPQLLPRRDRPAPPPLLPLLPHPAPPLARAV